VKLLLVEDNKEVAEAIFDYFDDDAFELDYAANGILGLKVTMSKHGFKVIDSGVGLDEKAHGYEGFVIGLLIVNDICIKYQR